MNLYNIPTVSNPTLERLLSLLDHDLFTDAPEYSSRVEEIRRLAGVIKRREDLRLPLEFRIPLEGSETKTQLGFTFTEGLAGELHATRRGHRVTNKVEFPVALYSPVFPVSPGCTAFFGTAPGGEVRIFLPKSDRRSVDVMPILGPFLDHHLELSRLRSPGRPPARRTSGRREAGTTVSPIGLPCWAARRS